VSGSRAGFIDIDSGAAFGARHFSGPSWFAQKRNMIYGESQSVRYVRASARFL
jgi:hypothetical protein